MEISLDEYGRPVVGMEGHPPGPVIPPPPVHPRSGKWGTFLHKFLADHPTCEGCGRKAETGHHRVPFGHDPALELDESNIIPVCVPCHFVLCHAGNWRTFVPEPDGDLKDHSIKVQYALPINGA